MNPTDLHDHDLEARLRAVLAERAETVTGPLPDLPLRGDLLAPALSGTAARPRRALRWVAAAAAVGVVGWGAAVAVGPGPERTTTGADPAPTSAPPASSAPRETGPATNPATNPAASELPGSVDLGLVTPLFAAGGDAIDVARAYLVDRFGDGVTELEERLAVELALTAAPSPGDGVTALAFEQDGSGSERLPTGTVFVRRDADRWAVVAAVTEGLSLANLQRDGTGLRGTATGDPGDPNLAAGLGLAVTPLGEEPPLLEQHESAVDQTVDEVPVVVTAWAAEGRTLAVTEFVSDPPRRSDAIWEGTPGDANRRRDPESTARALLAGFAADPLVGAIGVEGTEPAPPLDNPADTGVLVTIEGGLTLTVDLARTTAGWVVVALEDETDLAAAGGVEMTGPDGTLPVHSIRLGIPDSVTSATLAYWDESACGPANCRWSIRGIDPADLDVGPDDAHVEQPGMDYLKVDFDPPQGLTRSFLVGRDAEGRVVTIQASAWG